ncbi:hypothetical protein Bca101_048261 [Brassica carinata]
MNEKANVSKELNARHRKILEGLLKHPENRECADCKTKYEEKRWVSKGEKARSPPRVEQARRSVERTVPGYEHGHTSSPPVNLFEEKKAVQAPRTRYSVSATRISLPVPPQGPAQVIKPQQKVESVETTKAAVNVAPASEPPKVDFATDLFDMLSMDEPTANPSEAAPADDNWAGFQSAGNGQTVEKSVTAKPDEISSPPATGIEDLFNDTPTLVAQQAPQKDVKGDIMSLFEKTNIVSPFAMHQQQVAMLAQQQALYMAAAKAAGGTPNGANQQAVANALNLASANWSNTGYQIPGMTNPGGGQADLQKLMQNMNMNANMNMRPAQPQASTPQYPVSSFYTTGQVNPAANGMTPNSTVKPQSSSSATSTTPSSQTGKDFDFSSLMDGMFTKH